MTIDIVGGGVAGIACAIALTQEGVDVSVHERHAEPSTLGAGVVLWPNAVFVLDQLGVLDEVAAASGRPQHMHRFDQAGTPLGSLDIRLINDQLGYPSLSILRSDLHAILMNRLHAIGGAIRFGHAVSAIGTGRRGRACVRFADGSSSEPDLVIGADGRMASQARRFVHGRSEPVFQGFINWVGVYESADDRFESCDVGDYWGVGERFGIVPVTPRKAYWAAGQASSAPGGHDQATLRRLLRAFARRWPRHLATLIEQTPDARISTVFVHDHDPLRTWHRDNLLLVGDAAHAPLPTSGQGACQALEDAWHLARCLQRDAGDLQQAFAAFTRTRYEKTARIIDTGRALAAELFSPDPAVCEARNARSRAIDYPAMAAGMARGWGQGLPLAAAWM